MYYSRFFKQLALVSCSLALFACKPASQGESKKDGKILAEVNGNAITVGDFNAELENLPPYVRPMAQTPEGKKELLNRMIIRELVLEQAKKDGIDKSKEVAARMEDVKKMVIVEAYVRKKIESEVKVSDDDMKKFYDQNKDKFKTGEQIRASHILVKTEKEAQDVLDQLKKGASFEDLAKKYSKDASAAKGGDLGWFSKGAMVPEFEKAAFSLKPGQVSGIVQTPYGFHIIKVTGERPAGVRSFDEVKDQIKAALMPAKQQEAMQQLQDNLKKDAKISVKEDVLNAMSAKADENGAQPAPASK